MPDQELLRSSRKSTTSSRSSVFGTYTALALAILAGVRCSGLSHSPAADTDELLARGDSGERAFADELPRGETLPEMLEELLRPGLLPSTARRTPFAAFAALLPGVVDFPRGGGGDVSGGYVAPRTCLIVPGLGGGALTGVTPGHM